MTKKRALTRSGNAGVYRYEAEKVRGVVKIVFKSPGGKVLATGSGKTINTAAENAADASSNERLTATGAQTVLPDVY